MTTRALFSACMIFCLTLLLSAPVIAQSNSHSPVLKENVRLNNSVSRSSEIAPDATTAHRGHCVPTIIAEANCLTQTVELKAYISWTFTGIFEPHVANWSTGETAHKITVSPPGIWSWDATQTGCEDYHFDSEIELGTFFNGNLEILGPSSICFGTVAELTVESGGYVFHEFQWDPAGTNDSIPTYEISAPGTYSVSVTDDLGCGFSAEITVQADTVLVEEEILFCTGDTIYINGMLYTESGTVVETIPSGSGGCDTVVIITLTALPLEIRSETIEFCTGDTLYINGQFYTESGTIEEIIPSSTGGCDTVLTITLIALSNPVRSETIEFCIGDTLYINGQLYTESGTVVDTLFSGTGSCDTIVTYTLTRLPLETRFETIEFCVGDTIYINGQLYTQPGTVVLSIPSGTGGCDTIVTITLNVLPSPTRAETISFCPGDIVQINGVAYTQPGTVVDIVPSNSGICDTIVTYTLQYSTPAPSSVSINCPSAITVSQTGSAGTVVNYNLPSISSDCVCPGMSLDLSSGLSAGGTFPLGTTVVCYTTKDSCGQSASCCFNVSVEADVEDACDVKVNGCVKYELLSITANSSGNRTYRIRVTNNCANKLIYTSFQLPNGMVAVSPANLSVYTAPSGNTYLVRNPSFSPQYSIRFSSISDSIHNGSSDVFEYTLPTQANVNFIHAVSRLAPNISNAVHLNAFNCPIGSTSIFNDGPTENRAQADDLFPTLAQQNAGKLRISPNPAHGFINVDTRGQSGEMTLYNALGHQVRRVSVGNSVTELSVEDLSPGVYQVVFMGEQSVMHGTLVVQR